VREDALDLAVDQFAYSVYQPAFEARNGNDQHPENMQWLRDSPRALKDESRSQDGPAESLREGAWFELNHPVARAE
jgi:hypothetical protein